MWSICNKSSLAVFPHKTQLKLSRFKIWYLNLGLIPRRNEDDLIGLRSGSYDLRPDLMANLNASLYDLIRPNCFKERGTDRVVS